jgi:DNA-binding MarR family transcriptional regulator
MPEGTTLKDLGRRDVVDGIIDQWRQVRPDLDYSGTEVWARITRARLVVERRFRELQARHGLEPWEYDVLAALRRSDPPHEVSAGQLTRTMLVVPGTITNRIDRIAARGLIDRATSRSDRRSTVVRLTGKGRVVIDAAMPELAGLETDLLAGLAAREQKQLGMLLHKLMLSLGDEAQPDTSGTS